MNPANVTTLGPSGSWQTLSVQEFFSDINWDNLAVKKVPLSAVKAGARKVNPHMTVLEFFSVIPWDGDTVIAAPPTIDPSPPVQEEVENLTIDNFFGSF